MTQELTTQAAGDAAAPQSALIVQRGDDIHVSATTPEEMLHANAALIQWCVRKIADCRAEHAELDSAHSLAIERKWKSSTLKKHAALAAKRVTFYEKVKAALEAGFYIVPNFPVQIFAIRTTKDKPLRLMSFPQQSWRPGDNKVQRPEKLPMGEGEYQNPFPEVFVEDHGKTDPTNPNSTGKNWRVYAGDQWQEMEFPLSMSKPTIMEATSRAMALKIFEEFGILEQGKSGDPLIVGRLIDPRSTNKLFPRHITFIVAWHLDTRTI